MLTGSVICPWQVSKMSLTYYMLPAELAHDKNMTTKQLVMPQRSWMPMQNAHCNSSPKI